MENGKLKNLKMDSCFEVEMFFEKVTRIAIHILLRRSKIILALSYCNFIKLRRCDIPSPIRQGNYPILNYAALLGLVFLFSIYF